MALKALTLNPATFLNVQDKIGSLKKDLSANFFISNRSIFDNEAVVMQSWVAGEPTIFSDINVPDIRGNYILNTPDKKYKIKFSGDANKSAAANTPHHARARRARGKRRGKESASSTVHFNKSLCSEDIFTCM